MKRKNELHISQQQQLQINPKVEEYEHLPFSHTFSLSGSFFYIFLVLTFIQTVSSTYTWLKTSPISHGFVGVLPDGHTFEIGFNNKTWFTSSGIALRSNSTWFVTPFPNGKPIEPVCSLLSNSLYSSPGSERHYSEQTPGECCSLCKGTKFCKGFSWTPSDQNGSGPPVCELLFGVISGPFRKPGIWSGIIETPQYFPEWTNRTYSSSYDVLGTCETYSIRVSVPSNNPDNNVSYVYFAIHYCPHSDVFVFESFFTDRITNTATSFCFHNDSFDRQFANNSTMPLCSTSSWSFAFPALSLSSTAPKSQYLSSLTWRGQWAKLEYGQGIRAYGSAGGPVAIYDTTPGRTKNLSVAFGAFSSYKDVILSAECGLFRSCSIVGGGSGYLTEIPSYSSFATLLSFSPDGPLNALRKWGSSIQLKSKQIKHTPIISSYLGFWTDTASYYGSSQWLNSDQKDGTLKNVLSDAQETLSLSRMTVKYFHVGSFWHKLQPNSPCSCFSTNETVDFIGEEGISGILGLLGTILLHVPSFCENSSYAEGDWWKSCTLTASGNSTRLGSISPLQSYTFWHDRLYGWFRNQNVNGSVILLGHTEYQYYLFPQMVQTFGSFETWLEGLTNALSERGMSLILDLPMPSDFIEAAVHSEIAAVHFAPTIQPSESLVSKEYDGSLLLAFILGVPILPGSLPTGEGALHPLVRGVASVMLGGPVGLGDRAWRTDPSVLKPLCMPDGTLLRPLNPAVPQLFDLYGDISRFHLGRAWVSSSIIGTSNENQFYQALIVGKGVSLDKSLLYPPPKQNVQFLAWTTSSPTCCDGCSADNCIFDPFDASSHVSQTENELWQIFPVWETKWALLGELDKYIAVSSSRFTNVQQNSYGRIEAELVGVPGEILNIAVLVPYPKPTIRIISQQIGPSGTITINS